VRRPEHAAPCATVVAVLYLLAVLVGTFVISGVVPRSREVVARRKRVEEFERQYAKWAGADSVFPDDDNDLIGTVVPAEWGTAMDEARPVVDKLRPWLVARRDEMQRDARAAGRGVMYVAPPPMIGGGYVAHYYFTDLFDTQTNSVGSSSFRIDELASIVHETKAQEEQRRRDTVNPWAWLRLSFERTIGFPRYVLRHVGFSEQAADSTGARLVAAVWSFAVGGAGIAGFVISVIKT
jgi:hypothetical protein